MRLGEFMVGAGSVPAVSGIVVAKVKKFKRTVGKRSQCSNSDQSKFG